MLIAALAPAAQASRHGAAVGGAGTDYDGDGVEDPGDQCSVVAGPPPTGCPVESRRIALRFVSKKQRIAASVKAAHPSCESEMKVRLLRKRAGEDEIVATGRTDASGKVRLGHGLAAGAYYATTPRQLAPGVADCAPARSGTIRTPRNQR
jgi:hypothetical protein